MALRGGFPANMIFELRMSGGFNKEQRPPTIDIWRKHLELDHRQFAPVGDIKYGQLFLKDDREIAS